MSAASCFVYTLSFSLPEVFRNALTVLRIDYSIMRYFKKPPRFTPHHSKGVEGLKLVIVQNCPRRSLAHVRAVFENHDIKVYCEFATE
ncbi:hypothetical protein SNOG_04277 [Parastagonospora nodorum SN15]|uniref:Uncharacterized protein n=1 Tax=Phaeosphaeria nodorum (strain SN15 / ATCC MYA-4574 / FGSC 10173) TaxID=321614 RepID=Q0UVD7_PHANO|nr:hypothetical protein SNOG_04277 [Parastagonospora nodorum SN15]EAT88037.1 hypothetical protein SNOG_04277 [Parastagonospora nodorum SN15]